MAFLALIVAQAAHSIEEYVFRLFEVLAPARFISGLQARAKQIRARLSGQRPSRKPSANA